MLWPIQQDHHGISGTRKSTVRVQRTAVCDSRPAREKSSDCAQCAHCYSASVRVWQHGDEYVDGSSLGAAGNPAAAWLAEWLCHFQAWVERKPFWARMLLKPNT